MKICLSGGDKSLRNDRKMRKLIRKTEVVAILLYTTIIAPACYSTPERTVQFLMLDASMLIVLFVFELTFIWMMGINSYYDGLKASFGLGVGMGLILGVMDTIALSVWLDDTQALIGAIGCSALDWSVAPRWLIALTAIYAFVVITLTICLQIGYWRDRADWKAHNQTTLSESEKPLTFLEYCAMFDSDPKNGETKALKK